MPPRCIKCLTTLMPDATACPNCGRPATSKSALTQQRDIDKTQFIQIAPGDLLPGDLLPGDLLPGDLLPGDLLPGDLLPEDKLPGEPAVPPVTAPAFSRRSLVLAMVLGLLAGALLLLMMVGLSHARH